MANEKKLGPLEEINRILKENRVDQYRSPNLALGLKPVEFSLGASRWVWKEQPELALNPFGTIQGGYLALFVDELFATAIGSVLEEGEWAVTADLRISYLRASRSGPLEGSAKVVRRAPNVAFLEGKVSASGNGETVVSASSTWAISRA